MQLFALHENIRANNTGQVRFLLIKISSSDAPIYLRKARISADLDVVVQ
jgi:hypothetical protein